jgi:hypothetical protein
MKVPGLGLENGNGKIRVLRLETIQNVAMFNSNQGRYFKKNVIKMQLNVRCTERVLKKSQETQRTLSNDHQKEFESEHCL